MCSVFVSLRLGNVIIDYIIGVRLAIVYMCIYPRLAPFDAMSRGSNAQACRGASDV